MAQVCDSFANDYMSHEVTTNDIAFLTEDVGAEIAKCLIKTANCLLQIATKYFFVIFTEEFTH